MKNTITVYIFYRFTFYLFLMLLFNKNKINHLPLQFQSLLQALCWVDPLHIGWHWFSLGLFSSRSQTCEKVFKIKNDLVIVRIISISQYRIPIYKRAGTSKAAWRGNMQTIKGKRDFAKRKKVEERHRLSNIPRNVGVKLVHHSLRFVSARSESKNGSPAIRSP